MMSLSEIIDLVNEEYKQSTIQAKVFDFEKREDIDSIQPKYFYRGEDCNYDNTFSSLSRFLVRERLNNQEFEELVRLQYDLYLFLRKAIWMIPSSETNDHGNSNIELAICGILQHYGFDTSFLDVTSNINVAANFASTSKVGSIGKIFVINSHSLNIDKENYYFDLTRCKGSRPKNQDSYVIWDQFMSLNLKDKLFLSKHKGKWFDFILSKKDKEIFCDSSILSVKNDEVYHQISEWWIFSDSIAKINSRKIREIFAKRVEELKKHA